MNAIECLALLSQENVAMVKRLLRPAETEDDARRSSSDIVFIWPREPGEILTPVSTPTEYDCRVRHTQAAETEELRKDSSNESA
jgi:hypothetical protein